MKQNRPSGLPLLSGVHFVPQHQVGVATHVPTGVTASRLSPRKQKVSYGPRFRTLSYCKSQLLSRPDRTLVARNKRISDSLRFSTLTIFSHPVPVQVWKDLSRQPRSGTFFSSESSLSSLPPAYIYLCPDGLRLSPFQ